MTTRLISKEHRNYWLPHHVSFICPATGYPNLESIIISKELVVLFLMICKRLKIYVVAINLKYKKLDNTMHLLIFIHGCRSIRLQLNRK